MGGAGGLPTLSRMIQLSPFRYFRTSPEIIRVAVMLNIRFALTLWNVEDLLHERGIEVSHVTVRAYGQDPLICSLLLRRCD